jgi:hypothetical protein
MRIHSFPLLEGDGIAGKTIIANFLDETPFMYNDANGMFDVSLLPGQHTLTFALGDKKEPYNVQVNLEEGKTYIFYPDKDSIRIVPDTPFAISKALVYTEPTTDEPYSTFTSVIKKGKLFIYKIDNKWVSAGDEIRILPGDHEIQACVLISGSYLLEPLIIKTTFEAGAKYHIEYSVEKDNSVKMQIIKG